MYQLLEEMMDFGYALTTEPNALKLMIKPPSVLGKSSKCLGQRNIAGFRRARRGNHKQHAVAYDQCHAHTKRNLFGYH